MDEANISNDQKVALWAKLSDVSTVRNAMKKEWKAMELAAANEKEKE